MSGNREEQAEKRPPDENGDISASLIDMMLNLGGSAELDNIEEPTMDDLAAIDQLDDLDQLVEIDTTLDAPPDLQAAIDLFAEPEEPELVSLEGLDDDEEPEVIEEDLEEVEELLEDAESMIDDYVDIDLDDDELDDEGYDLDDEDVNSYHDLYGADDTIIPSFREGEFAEDDEGDTEYYDDMR